MLTRDLESHLFQPELYQTLKHLKVFNTTQPESILKFLTRLESVYFFTEIRLFKSNPNPKTLKIFNGAGFGPPVQIFNDSIHGHIEMHPVCVHIIDTPQFQRLRAIKQLGVCYWVFPGATNNRFEHSIGVGYLAGQMARHLQAKQPELGITELDILCVEIAGLCHDLGHGPFSHLFDRHFIPNVLPTSSWSHEKGSIDMLRYMLKDNPKLQTAFKAYGVDETNVIFVCELIAGPLCEVAGEEEACNHHQNGGFEVDLPYKKYRRSSSICTHPHPKGWKYRGRDKGKSFLYEIVANHKTGVDVDKWDYFARDCHHLGIRNNFDYTRLIKFNRVIPDENGLLTICFRDKEAKNLYDMFHTRDTLHRKAYQHRVSNIIEAMVTEAFAKANDYLFFPGSDGKMLKMTEAINDMVAYCHLTDNVFYKILDSTDPELAPARYMLNRIQKRSLFKHIGQFQFNAPTDIEDDIVRAIKEQIVQSAYHIDKSLELCLSAQDLVVQVVLFDYGMEDINPMENVLFYSKDHPNETKRIKKAEVSTMLPDLFIERYVRVYLKKEDFYNIPLVIEAFKLWFNTQTIFKYQEIQLDPLLSPVKFEETRNPNINRKRAMHF